jgi:hypothetical protein
VLVLLLLTSLTMTYILGTTAYQHGLWSARIAPVLASGLLASALTVAVKNLDVLLGVPADHPLTWVVPLTVATTLVLGAAWATYLRACRPWTYTVIGMGPDAARATGSVSNGRGAR